jgi:hypothetical protein
LRPSFNQIKTHEWYHGNIATSDEISRCMIKRREKFLKKFENVSIIKAESIDLKTKVHSQDSSVNSEVDSDVDEIKEEEQDDLSKLYNKDHGPSKAKKQKIDASHHHLNPKPQRQMLRFFE